MGRGRNSLNGTSRGQVANMIAVAISFEVPATRQVIAGTGLTGGGDLSADRTFAVAYGTGAGTAAQGNDSRITGAAQKSANLSDLGSVVTARTNLQLGTVALLDVDTDPTLAANSDSKIASQKAVKSFVAAAVTGLLKFQASQDCSGNPNYPAAVKGDSYVVSVAGKIGGGSGIAVDAGDVYFADADNAGGTQAAVGTSWVILEHNLQGALLAANNLSDLINAATGRTNLGVAIGLNVQAYSAVLTTYAGIAPTAIAQTILAAADAAAVKVALSLDNVNNTTDAAKPVSTATQTALDLKAALASPALSGTPTAPTATADTNSTQVATTAYADAIKALKANIASPTFTGVPAAPTAAAGNNSTQLATTAYADRMLPKAGGTMSGAIAMGSNKITGLAAATASGDAVGAQQAAPAMLCFKDGTSGTITVAAALTYYIDPWTGTTPGTTTEVTIGPLPAGMINGVWAKVDSNSLSSVVCTFTLFKNKTTSLGLSWTLAAGDTTAHLNVTNPATIAAGDTLSIRMTSSGSGTGSWSGLQINCLMTIA